MGRLGNGSEKVPWTQVEFWTWVQYFIGAIETIFGKVSPLLPMLHQLKNSVSSDKKFPNHGPEEWRAYFWKYHCTELAENWSVAIAKMRDRAYKVAKGANKQFSIKSIFPNGIQEAFGTMSAMLRPTQDGKKETMSLHFHQREVQQL